MDHRVCRHLCARLVLALPLVAGAALPAAAAGEDPDWPCVQALVPEVSGAMIWAGPPLDGAAGGAWRDDPAVRDLAADLAARRTPLDEAEQRVAAFADTLDPEVRDENLTSLFAGVLETINRERSSIITGIRRFARQQRSLGDEIRAMNALLRDLPHGPDASAEEARRREIEEQRVWSVRIFDEREDALTYLCEQPVLLEQRAFALARTIAAHLES